MILQLYKVEDFDRFTDIYPHGHHKTDKLGRPIYIERIGMIDMDKLFKLKSQEDLLKYYIKAYEQMRIYMYPIVSLAAGRRIETSLTILDLNGGNSSLLSSS